MSTLKTILIAGLGFGLLVVLASCSKSPEQKVSDAKADVVVAKEDVKVAEANAQLKAEENAAREEWLKFKYEKEAIIAVNDTIITNYKAKMTYTSGKLRAKYDKNIDSLELRNKELKTKLNDYKDNGKNAWDKFKGEFNHDIDQLGTALKGFTVDSKK
jgi:cell division protein FtsB